GRPGRHARHHAFPCRRALFRHLRQRDGPVLPGRRSHGGALSRALPAPRRCRAAVRSTGSTGRRTLAAGRTPAHGARPRRGVARGVSSSHDGTSRLTPARGAARSPSPGTPSRTDRMRGRRRRARRMPGARDARRPSGVRRTTAAGIVDAKAPHLEDVVRADPHAVLLALAAVAIDHRCHDAGLVAAVGGARRRAHGWIIALSGPRRLFRDGDGGRGKAVHDPELSIGPYELRTASCRPWDARAPEVAARVAALIRTVLPVARVEHIGRTSGPGG